MLKDLGHDETAAARAENQGARRNGGPAGKGKIAITPDAKRILLASTIRDNVLILPPEPLDRPIYEAVNKVLGAGGGKWKRGTGHVFPSAVRLNDLRSQWTSGDEVVHVKKTTQAFYTPPTLATKVVEMAGVNGLSVLEPSAGQGAIVKECFSHGAIEVWAVELDETNRKELSLFTAGSVVIGDFLGMEPTDLYDRVVMNPPFTKGQDIQHVTHAMKFLKPGGRLVAIMSPGWVGSTRKAHQAFRNLVEFHDGEIEELAAGAFKGSGTNIRTVIVTMTKTA